MQTERRFPLLLLAFGLLAIAALASACSSDGGETTEADPDDIIVEAEATPEAFDPTDSDQLAGVSTSPSNIESGDCFNEYLYRDRSEFLQQITTIVGCSGPHDREAYFTTQYPGDEDDPAPPEDTLRRWAEARCLEEFEAFVGQEYVLSALEIGVIVPSFSSWNDEDDRGVTCFVYPDEDGHRLRSTVRNSGL